jgi:hypothetical protein
VETIESRVEVESKFLDQFSADGFRFIVRCKSFEAKSDLWVIKEIFPDFVAIFFIFTDPEEWDVVSWVRIIHIVEVFVSYRLEYIEKFEDLEGESRTSEICDVGGRAIED